MSKRVNLLKEVCINYLKEYDRLDVNYDKFVEYIDDGSQYNRALAINAEVRKKQDILHQKFLQEVKKVTWSEEEIRILVQNNETKKRLISHSKERLSCSYGITKDLVTPNGVETVKIEELKNIVEQYEDEKITYDSNVLLKQLFYHILYEGLDNKVRSVCRAELKKDLK